MVKSGYEFTCSQLIKLNSQLVNRGKPVRATKAQERRERMISIAKEVFCEHGYEGASMSLIAARVGGSKGTLYNYFPSKNDLLLATMLAAAEDFQQAFAETIDESQPLEQILSNFVKQLLQLLYQDENTAKLLRVVISVGGSTDVGRRFFEYIGGGVWIQITQILTRHIQTGELRQTDAQLMTTNLQGLCDADMLRMLMGAMPPMSDKAIQQRTQQIVTAFLRTYGTAET